MSQEDRALNPGNILKGIGEMLDGDGVGDLPGIAEQVNPYGMSDQVPAGQWQWQQAPYAPPFNLPTGGTYPQMYQIPWSQFPDFPYRPEELPGAEQSTEGLTELENRMPHGHHHHGHHHHHFHPWHGFGGYPGYGYPGYGYPGYGYPGYGYPGYGYPGYGYPRPFPYGGAFPYRDEEVQSYDTREQSETENRENNELVNAEDSRFGIGLGGPLSGFGFFPGFGFGFPGFPFYRPFYPFYGYPFYRPFYPFHRPWW